MNLGLSILYAALTVILAAAPFGVFRHRLRNNYGFLLITFIWAIVVNHVVTGYLFYIKDYPPVMYYLHYIFWGYMTFGPFVTHKIFHSPKTIQATVVTAILLFLIFLVSSFLLIPLGIGSFGGVL